MRTKRLHLRKGVSYPSVVRWVAMQRFEAQFGFCACKRGTIPAYHVGRLGRSKQAIQLLMRVGIITSFVHPLQEIL
jgi:hypothetical protein